jgi:hypothetical protein
MTRILLEMIFFVAVLLYAIVQMAFGNLGTAGKVPTYRRPFRNRIRGFAMARLAILSQWSTAGQGAPLTRMPGPLQNPGSFAASVCRSRTWGRPGLQWRATLPTPSLLNEVEWMLDRMLTLIYQTQFPCRRARIYGKSP